MATCTLCFNSYSDERAKLGYLICTTCGDQAAKLEKQRRSRCLAPAYNKGAYQYIATREQAKDIVKK